MEHRTIKKRTKHKLQRITFFNSTKKKLDYPLICKDKTVIKPLYI